MLLMTGRPEFRRLPEHLGIIPDGNRRWADARGLPRQAGYAYGLSPALDVCSLCRDLGIREVTFYGFTQDNTRRAKVQRQAFQQACVEAVGLLEQEDVELLIIGNTESAMFPQELIPYTRRVRFGSGSLRVNMLVNYSWQWDLSRLTQRSATAQLITRGQIPRGLGSAEVSRISLVVRWGGRSRLSGFLPVQTVYSDFRIVDDLWPDFRPEHLHNALAWYQQQDVTLGG